MRENHWHTRQFDNLFTLFQLNQQSELCFSCRLKDFAKEVPFVNQWGLTVNNSIRSRRNKEENFTAQKGSSIMG